LLRKIREHKIDDPLRPPSPAADRAAPPGAHPKPAPGA
jgi:hypothetical protein